jgi:nickel-dependent lactate racemase
MELRYGDRSLPLEIDQRFDAEIITPRVVATHPDLPGTIHRLLENPVDSVSLSQRLSHIETVAIVVNSEQDFELNISLLDLLVDILNASITSPEDIRIFYPPKRESGLTAHDVDVLLGKQTYQGHQVLSHNSDDNESLCYIGDTSIHSTPVLINKAFAEADIKIGIGTIRCNGFVGATGGRMSVIPHVAGQKTVVRNTKLQATHPVGPFRTDTAACIDMDEISDLAGLDFIVNMIPDHQNNMASIVAGAPRAAWLQGLDVCRAVTEVTIQRRADIAVVSTGGGLSDATLDLAVDSLFAGYNATEYGGSILLIAECAEGLGAPSFLRAVSDCASPSEVALLAEASFEPGMERAHLFWKVLSSRNLIICSRLRESLVSERFHCLAVRNPQEGFELARQQMVSIPRVAVIPEGTKTMPVPRMR